MPALAPKRRWQQASARISHAATDKALDRKPVFRLNDDAQV
jgi:hypothetical protein